MSGNLSNYFSNDQSLFDQLQPDYLQTLGSEVPDKLPVPEDVANIWVQPSKSQQLTFPILVTADLPDHIFDSCATLLGEDQAAQRRANPALKIDEVTRDDRGLRILIEKGYYRAAINLTSHLLSNYSNSLGQPTKITNHSLQLWFTRLALLVKLGELEIVQTEAANFGMLDRPDMFYDFYPEMNNGRKGSMASFSFRLLLADLPQFCGAARTSIDRLSYLNSIVDQICQHYEKIGYEDAKKFWKRRSRRVLHSIINAGLLAKDYQLVDSIMNRLTNEPLLETAEKSEYLSLHGRILLQIGDVHGAEKKFLAARKFKTARAERELIDRGLMAVAQNDFQEAYKFFQSAHLKDPNSVIILNNICVCLLYTGRLKEAIKMYETTIDKNITSAMNSEFLINLATLYELETTDANTKKLDLLKKISLNVVDCNVNLLNCLKLQNIGVPC